MLELRDTWDKYQHLGSVPSVEQRMKHISSPAKAKNITISNRYQALSCVETVSEFVSSPARVPAATVITILGQEKRQPLPKKSHSEKWWTGDTGCGHDLVERKDVACPAKQVQTVGKSVSLRTANGAVQATERAQFAFHELFERINPVVMKSTLQSSPLERGAMD